MATTETDVAREPDVSSAAKAQAETRAKKPDSIIDKVLRLLSSVRFGIVMLAVLLTCCMIGMLIMQVNVEGFDKYYAELKPAQRVIYGALNLFDIYHSRYFTLLLAITGLNIILASIDRFPAAWSYVVKPKLKASPKFIAAQMFNGQHRLGDAPAAAAEKIKTRWRRMGFRSKVNEEGGRITVFAQRNVLNRLGAYSVHVALLTIFIGGFLTSRYGVGGSLELTPGRTSNTFITQEVTTDGTRRGQAVMPFQIACLDLQQKLIRPEGGLEAQNTIDWLSKIRIMDGDVRKELTVHLNNVGDYRGYRFFQSQFEPVGNAREITLRFDPTQGGEPRTVSVRRDGSADVEGIGRVNYKAFFPDFRIGQDGNGQTASADYNNPVAQLEIELADGSKRRAFAFFDRKAEEALMNQIKSAMGSEAVEKATSVNGYKVSLKEFEKVSTGHILTVQYDPGRTPVYVGFILLSLSLCGVFFFAHERVWAVIEPDGTGSKVHFGGHTNRNRPAFEARFNSLVQTAIGGSKHE